MLTKQEYLPGHSDRELERLQLQARCLEGLTRRLIRECGLTQGMRVLDIGCGAGDVAMLVAEVVGATGKVVAIDPEKRAVETARSRAIYAGFSRIEFVIGTDENLCQHAPFDAAIGRCVLVHQSNPTVMVRRAAAAVRPGGIVAFMEPALHVDFQTIPEIALLQSATECAMRFQRIALPNHDIVGRIIPCFIDAGLPEPQVLWESIVPGSDRRYLGWLVATYETLLPLMERFGVRNSGVGDAATLYNRLDVAITAARAQGLTLPYVSAWAKRN
jgi:ubiquinone/menaquinone biosynthesis C-methylase UbiE